MVVYFGYVFFIGWRYLVEFVFFFSILLSYGNFWKSFGWRKIGEMYLSILGGDIRDDGGSWNEIY